MNTILLIIAALLIPLGIVGIIVPFLPGLSLVWVSLVVLAWVSDFTAISATTLFVTGIITAAALGIDYVSGTVGAKKFGASTYGVTGSIIGMLAGLTFLPLGLIVGPFAGAVIGELLYGASHKRAFKAGIGTLLGFLGGTLIQFILALILTGYFIAGLIRYWT